MVHCCVPFCSTNSSSKAPGVSFHDFPVDNVMKQLWLCAICREDEASKKAWTPSDRSVVCSQHFKESDYKPGLKTKRLIPGTVPSVFSNYPAHKQKKITTPRRVIIKRTSTRSVDNLVLPSSIQPMIEEGIFPCESMSKDASFGTTITVASMAAKELKFKSTKRQCQRLRMRVQFLNATIVKLKKANQTQYQKLSDYNIKCLEKDFINDNSKAKFIIEQLKCYNKRKPRWSDGTVRRCILWHSKSPAGYRFVREAKILSLPSKTTLKRHIGATSGQKVTSLMKMRLQQECAKLKETERVGSLLADEMAMKPKVIYNKAADEVVGMVSMNGREEATGKEQELANKLLCFVFVGVCTRFRLPVGYFFTNNLTGKELYSLWLDVLKEVEIAGFRVIRSVVDDASVNVKLYKTLCKGELQPMIPHPLDDNRVMFLSFDPCHILKNLRNQLLSQTRELTNQGKPISGNFIRSLYHLQKDSVLKPVRHLTHKHVYPSNLDKMNVRRAVDIFSQDVIAALKFLQLHGSRFGALNFSEAAETIKFLEIVQKWFTIHNVKNTHHHIFSRNNDAMQFFSVDDERLIWLNEYFLTYLQSWKDSCPEPAKQPKGVPKAPPRFLSLETYEAVCLTTKSTVLCIKYLLMSGFQYVLTRKFNSDDIENLFSAIRQLSGSNDQTNAASVTYALHKILTTGLISASHSGNVENSPCVEWMATNKEQSKRLKCNPVESTSCITALPVSAATEQVVESSSEHIASQPPQLPLTSSSAILEDGVSKPLNGKLQPFLKKLQELPVDMPVVTVASGVMSYIGGFLVQVVGEKVECAACFDRLASIQSCAPMMTLIAAKDRGGLRYPKPRFVMLLLELERAVKVALPYVIKKPAVMTTLCQLLLPSLQKNPMMICTSASCDSDNARKLCLIILKKFIRPYITNYTNTVNNQYYIEHKKAIANKPLSRKILKVTPCS